MPPFTPEIMADEKRAIQFIHDLLELLVQQRGSDLFITVGFPPAIKSNGKLTPVSKTPLEASHVHELVTCLMNKRQLQFFEDTKECNYAYSIKGLGRFRVSAFLQQGWPGMVLRYINTKIPAYEELGLPFILKDVILAKRGIIIFIGATGAGKSTSMASLLGYRNQNSFGHIITIEDPIEYVHEHAKCIVTQREVGSDTDSWEVALQNSLRQAPDVIMIGEIRTREGMDFAITFAETGHLCLATLHANSTNQALDRIINFFPEDRRAQVLMDLSLNVRAFVAQRLVLRADGRGRVPAAEVLINTPLVSDLIFKGDVPGIKDVMKRSREQGMQTFDQSLFDLYDRGLITYEDALRNADSINDLRLQIKLHSKEARARDAFTGTEHLSMIADAPLSDETSEPTTMGGKGAPSADTQLSSFFDR
jgi:twitching motility protein PilU